MRAIKKRLIGSLMAVVALVMCSSSNTFAAKADDYTMVPPFLTNQEAPLVMLVMGRNHKLYYEAYNDASDLNEDGGLDVGYKGLAETFTDKNGNKEWDIDFGEPYTDADGDGQFDPQEEYTDANSNDTYDSGDTIVGDDGDCVYEPAEGETYTDVDGNGTYDAGETILNDDGDCVWYAGESYTDENSNGEYDYSEPLQDLNGDGVWNDKIDYYGYFDSYKCYDYDSGNGVFVPKSAPQAVNAYTGLLEGSKKCIVSGDGEWSGDFLNYLSMSRMDTLRKVLYGGFRSTDDADKTILERVFVPQDAHTWGKEYTSIEVDGYDLSEFTPLGVPVVIDDIQYRTLFASTTLDANGNGDGSDDAPVLRVLPNTNNRIWDWVAKEGPVANDAIVGGGGVYGQHIDDHTQWNDVMDLYANGDHIQGTRTMDNVDESGSNLNQTALSDTGISGDNYISVATATLKIGNLGGYNKIFDFGVTGDDSVEVVISGFDAAVVGDFNYGVLNADNEFVVGHYGGHSVGNVWDHSAEIELARNKEYVIEFRHHERTGGEGWRLKYKRQMNDGSYGPDWEDVNNANGLIVEAQWTQNFYDTATIVTAITDYDVRVEVCKIGLLEDDCQKYPNDYYKPVGILQNYGESGEMMFGLLSGSYANNTKGGVLRKNVGPITDEIHANTGQFLVPTSGGNIIDTINKFRVVEYGYNSNGGTSYSNCGWITTRAVNDDGECRMWGNPTSEMMYESLRYYAGTTATSDFTYDATTGYDTTELGLPAPVWLDPYTEGEDRDNDGTLDAETYTDANSNGKWDVSETYTDANSNGRYDTEDLNGDGTLNGFENCAKPFMMVLNDIYPTYDSNQVPGSAFPIDPDDIGSTDSADYFDEKLLSTSNKAMDVQELANLITQGEGTFPDSNFIGRNGATFDGACTQKDVTDLGQVRGLCPEEPTKEGSYYAAAVAYFGNQYDMSAVEGNQNVTTYSVALASPLPKINIKVNDKTITMIPFGKSVGGGSWGISTAKGDFQPSNTIVDFFVEEITETHGVFRVNFEDVEQGADHDMDAIVKYEYTVDEDAGTVDVQVDSLYASGSVIQHLGYIISGTEHDGAYLVVRDSDTGTAADPNYFLDTPWEEDPANAGTYLGCVGPNNPVDCFDDVDYLPLTSTRTFTPGDSAAATLLEDPLFYAAKWGGFVDGNTPTEDVNGNGVLDSGEDTNGNGAIDFAISATTPAGVSSPEDTDGDGVIDAESYDDVNGNSSYDAGEAYVDSNGNSSYDVGEPFTDENGNSTLDGDPYIDANGNGRYDTEDINGDGVLGYYSAPTPDVASEWDEDGNGVPDTYFYVVNPLRLVEQLSKSFDAMLRRASSGTAASVISNSRSGEGAIYQSLFFPQIKEDGVTISWAGEIHSLFVDSHGNMREDTNGNAQLNINKEDLNDNTVIDSDLSEDTNFNSVLDANEDLNNNGMLDLHLDEDLDGDSILDTRDLIIVFSGTNVWKYDDADEDEKIDVEDEIVFNPDYPAWHGNGTLDHEVFTDTDSDGVYDEGETYTDANGNGKFDTEDENGNGVLDTELLSGPHSIDEVAYLWSANDWLNRYGFDTLTQRTYDSTADGRYIFTFLDTDDDMLVDSGELVDFVTDASITATALTDNTKIYSYLTLYPSFTDLPAWVSDIYTHNDNNKEVFQALQAKRQIEYIRGKDQAATTVAGSVTDSATSVVTTYTDFVPAMRNRTYTDTDSNTDITWLLGDIVHSSPTVVGRPAEGYHLIYRDTSYAAFAAKHHMRRNVVYTGGNDGMIHAFNAGFYDSQTNEYKKAMGEYFTDTNDSGSWESGESFVDANGSGSYDGPTQTQYKLGAEMWAYIPHNLLPHLYWLTEEDYPHVYYNDMQPKIFDAKVFIKSNGDPIDDYHVNGWGTIMVMGMRLGGGEIVADMDHNDIMEVGAPADTYTDTDGSGDWTTGDVLLTDENGNGTWDAAVTGDDRKMSSAYVIFDITNPEVEPKVLAEITLDKQGYTTVYPAAIPMRSKSGTGSNATFTTNDWYLVFGSGPADSTGAAASHTSSEDILENAISKQSGKVFVLNLNDLFDNSTSTDDQVVKTIDINGDETSTAPFYMQELEAESFVSQPITVDYDLDYNADTVYFGTINGSDTSGWGGRMRRILINNEVAAGGTVSWVGTNVYGVDRADNWLIDLDNVESGQPITTAAAVTIGERSYNVDWNDDGTVDNSDRDLNGDGVVNNFDRERWVYFGTGRFYVRDDAKNSDQQSYYGLKEPYDNGAGVNPGFSGKPVTQAMLLNMTDAKVYDDQEVTGVVDSNDVSVIGDGDATKVDGTALATPYTGWQELQLEMAKSRGWWIDFGEPKERNIGQALLLGEVLTFTSYVPAMDICEFEGESWLWAFYYNTGTAYYDPILGFTFNDENGDGVVDAGEKLSISKLNIGKGLALTPNVHTGSEDGSRAFIQTSTGAIEVIEQKNPGMTKAGKTSWLEN